MCAGCRNILREVALVDDSRSAMRYHGCAFLGADRLCPRARVHILRRSLSRLFEEEPLEQQLRHTSGCFGGPALWCVCAIRVCRSIRSTRWWHPLVEAASPTRRGGVSTDIDATHHFPSFRSFPFLAEVLGRGCITVRRNTGWRNEGIVVVYAGPKTN